MIQLFINFVVINKCNLIRLIQGAFNEDTRGRIDYVNEFYLGNYCRVYRITHDNTSLIRAWQGHRIEVKAYWVVKGSFVINTVKVDDFDNINKDTKPETFKLEANESKILVICAVTPMVLKL